MNWKKTLFSIGIIVIILVGGLTMFNVANQKLLIRIIHFLNLLK